MTGCPRRAPSHTARLHGLAARTARLALTTLTTPTALTALIAFSALAALGSPCYAQTAAPAPPPEYQDHYIGGGTLTPDISSGDYGTPDGAGLARSIRVDGVASRISEQGQNALPATDEAGVILNTQWDTMSYGGWSLDGALRTAGSSRPGVDNYGSGSFSLHQRGMPFNDGWQADNALGDISAPLTSLARMQPRFFISQGPMEGFETEWRGPSGLQFVAGAGEPGVYNGIKVPVFEPLGGSTATAGGQWAAAPQVTVGAEFAAAHDVSLYYQPLPGAVTGVPSERISSTTGLLMASWQDAHSRAQLNLIDGTLDSNANSLGAWLDASHSSGRVLQSYGLFRIEPNLAWGNQLITSDVQGGYYRIDYQTRRWLTSLDIEQANSVSGNGPNTTFFSGSARYQLTRDLGMGGVTNVRRSEGGGTAWSVQGYFDNVNDWGIGRAQLDYATDQRVQDSTVTVQQSWAMSTGKRLATSAGLEHVQASGAGNSSSINSIDQNSSIVRIAVYGGGDLTARLSLDATIQWATAVQGRAAPSTSADVQLGWQLSRNWSFLADYYENRVGAWTPLVVSSPLSPPTPTYLPSAGQRGVFLTVRFQAARGAHFVPLGGAPGSGSGRLTGVVYLDANENGHYDAGETGAPNVTVILDGRYSVRTDATGRYDFPAVAAGHHVLTIQTDNLPLPWSVNNEGRTEVTVSTRDRTEVNIGALRLK
jgi:hypothetical protein